MTKIHDGGVTPTNDHARVTSGALHVIVDSGGGGGSVPTGTAGTPNAAVVTVQGINGGTPVSVAANISQNAKGEVTDQSGVYSNSGTPIVALAQNLNRKYLFIQNLDANLDLWFTLVGVAVITDTPGGVKLGPEEWIVFDSFVPTNAVELVTPFNGQRYTIYEF